MSDTPKPKKKRVNGAVKGKQYEREIAVKFRALYPDAKRGNQDNMVNTEADVEGTPFRVECKSLQSIGAFRFYDQARAEQKLHGDDRPIMVVMREKRNHVSGQLDLAMVPLGVMLELLRKSHELTFPNEMELPEQISLDSGVTFVNKPRWKTTPEGKVILL